MDDPKETKGTTMTPLTKIVRRQTEATVRDGCRRRRLVVTLYPNDTLGLRLSKTRREELVTLESIYALAVKQRIRGERAEIAATKRERKTR